MHQTQTFVVYILASHKNGSLYIGVTNDLIRRIEEHKSAHKPRSHTARYNIKRLVYFETFDDPGSAIDREKFLKKLTRARKVKLIEAENPDWFELFKGEDTVLW